MDGKLDLQPGVARLGSEGPTVARLGVEYNFANGYVSANMLLSFEIIKLIVCFVELLEKQKFF